MLLKLHAILILISMCLFFFFSSRRRHTRFDCDWSSDVCSSDLGVVPPLGMLPSGFISRRCRARAIAVLSGPSHAADALEHGASVVVGSSNLAFARQLADAVTTAGLEVLITSDVTGVELAGAATNAAVLAAAAAAPAGPNVAGAAPGKGF